MTEIHRDDRLYVYEKTNILPEVFKKKIMAEYHQRLKRQSRRDANLYLLNISEHIESAVLSRLSLKTLNADEDDLKKLAEGEAQECIMIWQSLSSESLKKPYKRILGFMAYRGIYPSGLKEDPSTSDMLSLIRRSINKSWWLSNLRVRQNRDIEIVARTLNFVKKNAQIYASDLNVTRRRWQKQNQHEFLENMLAINEEGQSFLLSELKATSVSNPRIRKDELMVRCRGFEDFAKAKKHTCIFITLTCPSKYHRAYSTSGDPTKNWDGSTPIDAQNYLKITFSRIRAELDRQGIRPYGFRVAEPHHDGTPHWHLLLFIKEDAEESLKEIFTHYAFEEDGNEEGADKHRITIVKIDPNKGSATGYIAKYISKNIDGENIDVGIYGENPTIAAKRIETWASVWGIRQFQQIGGAGVSIWRELRRMNPLDDPESIIELARKAADDSKWDDYLKTMGGDDCARKDRPIKLVYKDSVDVSSGVLKENQYGEIKAQSVYGIEHGSIRINTRPHTWEISRAS
jgi:hypothetical protein